MDPCVGEHLKGGKNGAKTGQYPTKKYAGNDGKWRTPQHSAKAVARVERGTALDVGFEGIWVTCARGAEKRAMAELITICVQYGHDIWSLPILDGSAKQSGQSSRSSQGNSSGIDDLPLGDGECDIETSIEREIQSMKSSGANYTTSKLRQAQVFTPIRSAMECVFFIRTRPPVVPLDLTMHICTETYHSPDGRLERMCRYINRITPVSTMDKATQNGILRVARRVLAPYFDLVADTATSELEQNTTQREETKECLVLDSSTTGIGRRRKCKSDCDKDAAADLDAYTYAIRPTIRHHSIFSSDATIKLIAGIVGPRHRVNLKQPDKVILVEIYQMLCGIEVVDGPMYETLKRFNVNEIRKVALNCTGKETEDHAKPTGKLVGP